MAQLKDIVIDCAHPASLARFWSAALSDYRVAPYPPEELQRLRALGITDPEDDPSVLVERVDGTGPRLFLTRVSEPKTGKNRLHLDLVADESVADEQHRDSRAAETRRLCELGATVIAQREEWNVLADPEGNEFCVF